ncbi:MAG: hypothetical protein Q9195_006402 [Heterodermia aff. obscurata]
MDPIELSCNWRRLQAKLKAHNLTPLKREASIDVLQPQQDGVKRLRASSPEVHRPSKRKRLGTRNSSKIGMISSRQSESASAPITSLALWAEENDISATDLGEAYGTSRKSTSIPSVSGTAYASEKVNEGLSCTAEPGKYIAVDCEMVGVGPDPANDSALARVSIVNYHGHQLYDSFVLPKEPVTDYRTFVSGITAGLLRSARTLEAVQVDVAKLLDGRILIGHSVRSDLDALLLGHPKRDIRDTSRYPGFRQYSAGRTPGLKKLAKEVLGIDIQRGQHSSIEDARATMLLFRREKDGFESEHAKRWGPSLKCKKAQGADINPARSKRQRRKNPKKMKT